MASAVTEWLRLEGFPSEGSKSDAERKVCERYLTDFLEFALNQRGQTYPLREVSEFQANPLQWEERWLDLNGEIRLSRPSTKEYQVVLCFDDDKGKSQPLSTGLAETLDRAFQLAIVGIDTAAQFLPPKKESTNG